MNEPRPHALFSFGTLLDERVQETLFGQAVPQTPAALAGHTTRPLRITDPEVIATSGLDVHLTLERRIGAEVQGAILHLTDADLAAADDYEVDDYVRRRARLSSGASAWAYLDARPLRSASRIVIVGDSIAYGRCDPQGGWAARLAAGHIALDETDHRVFNLAVPGSTLAEVAEQTPALLPARRPDTLVVAAGINDVAVVGKGPARLEESLDALAATALTHGARLVVVGPTWLDEDRAPDYDGLSFTRERASTLRENLRSWCTSHRIDHLDLWEPLRDRPDLLADGLHPTPEGHAMLHRHLMGVAL
ncbi:GDSL-type esterase/lipase family protein [Streptomyces sp. TLI_105]|uniref:SGNH/GDSL hydrolase family protein n=1 Tax=Streptomyces sp. TLI_105 TaxID=1881019 RepID=UPI000894A4F2|nr:GDSL-type esterase/lipase family protein [Streptomyces sp. TLI_105]SED16509.1 Lysophospholipase L1 [Streptomyces sp. TLI_105]